MTALSPKHKIKIVENRILQNGTNIGYLSRGGGEVWVFLTVGEDTRFFFGRFKYAKPMAKAKEYIKDILTRLTPAEYAAKRKEISTECTSFEREKTPAEIQAEVLGYESTIAYSRAKNPEFWATVDARYPR